MLRIGCLVFLIIAANWSRPTMSMETEQAKAVPYSITPVPSVWAVGDKPAYLVITGKNWSEFYATPPNGADFSTSIYIVAYMGVQPNPGYRIRIAQIRQDGNMIQVSIERLRPAPKQVYPQVLVHPVAVAEVKKTSLRPKGTLNFSFVDQTKQRIAQLTVEL